MLKNRLYILILMLVMVFLFGTYGYHFTENWSLFDSLFFTLVTVSTVGYSMPENITEAGKVVSAILIGAGITVVLYGFTSITSLIVEGHMKEYFKIRRMRKMLDSLRDHFIIIGADKTGRHTAAELKKAKKMFVVVEDSEESIHRLREFLNMEFPFVLGDAAEEEVLIKAGIKRARSLIITLTNDAKNILVVLTAKSLNPDLEIVSQASDAKTMTKLIYAGAHKVITTTELAGVRLAQLAINPQQVRFLDILSLGEEAFRIEEIVISQDSPVSYKTLGEINLSRITGTIVIAIKRKDETIFNPTGTTQILPGDRLMVIGKNEHFEKFHRIIEKS
ncbi:MAG TPA: potassium channel protein [Pseudothermotoga sp.]|uniref:potassium channel family protein n=1 Tax=Pseudothermotoga sp. TaxID=2033661 RepID=UPI00258AA5F6|nr:potassium channel protein [Pseudothermotoga sp.]MDK2885298.1 voltage-gated potassium channel [Pseudothermotoga sp.]HOJ88638.1 potassium channel protein [Pseudothermotoga sp.]HOK84482.1 potassium channel protein [Pseudothermotoga sp.]HPP70916.1 potassium channel protein [Pseudothermotoga sp.]